MSIEIKATIICDGGCGGRVHGPMVNVTTTGMSSYWDAKEEAENSGWIILERYGPAKHYCPTCADRVAQATSKPGEPLPPTKTGEQT